MKSLMCSFAEAGSRPRKRSDDGFGQRAIAYIRPSKRRLNAGGRRSMQQARPHSR